MKNRQFHTYKFNSSRLKEFDYDITLSFDDAKEYGEVIALFDNQILRSIRDVNNRQIDYDVLESLHRELDWLKRQEHSTENVDLIKNIQLQINDMTFIPEYITIVMDHPSHYKYLYKNGLKLNGKVYRRLSSSAGQARLSTVAYCEEETLEKLNVVLDNGRNLNKELVPSKFNAYKGVYSSATSVVSTPKICLVPDYFSNTTLDVNFVTETELNEDDVIEVKSISEAFNRFDGQGLISYEKATQWASELGLDYVPAQWCVRNSFLKGMLNTFPIHEFCEKVNNGNYRVRTSYNDENGNPKIVDLKDVDVIISESMFKLWESYPSIEAYEENLEKNNLKWGVSLYSPKKDKDILKMNYQFLQALRLGQKDIEKVCEQFVDWISGVTSENIYYTILFLIGTETNEEKVMNYLEKSKNHWIKSLIVNPELIKDKYIKKKIYDLIKRKIKNGCLGEILIDGNFQTLVSDPYAMMQYVCGLEVTGILKKKEYYSNYWNEKGVKIVDSMRAPLTYRSEHLLLNLKKTKELDYWYRYNYTGIIVNVHGAETMHWAGSDFDYDIIATTSNATVIKGVYQDELPVVYTPPKSNKKVLTQDDLFHSDLFSFGSAIGSITNKSTSGYALLPLFDENSEEYKVTMNRIRMCTKLQSSQIDKAKIGREVKGIPKPWINYQKPKKNDSLDVRENKEFSNRILLDKHPYFFTYLYGITKSKYRNHVKRYNDTCQQRFGMSVDELRQMKRKTKEHRKFLDQFEHYSPVNDSDCLMNNLCRHIESIDFGIKKIRDIPDNSDCYKLLINETLAPFNGERYKQVVNVYKQYENQYKKAINKIIPINYSNRVKSKYDEGIGNSVSNQYDKLKSKLHEVCSNEIELVNYLVRIFYTEQPSSNKEILWSTYGHRLYENVKSNTKSPVYIPVKDENGDFNYLNKKYTLKEVKI